VGGRQALFVVVVVLVVVVVIGVISQLQLRATDYD
jgi:hypothetical protein